MWLISLPPYNATVIFHQNISSCFAQISLKISTLFIWLKEFVLMKMNKRTDTLWDVILLIRILSGFIMPVPMQRTQQKRGRYLTLATNINLLPESMWAPHTGTPSLCAQDASSQESMSLCCPFSSILLAPRFLSLPFSLKINVSETHRYASILLAYNSLTIFSNALGPQSFSFLTQKSEGIQKLQRQSSGSWDAMAKIGKSEFTGALRIICKKKKRKYNCIWLPRVKRIAFGERD